MSRREKKNTTEWKKVPHRRLVEIKFRPFTAGVLSHRQIGFLPPESPAEPDHRVHYHGIHDNYEDEGREEGDYGVHYVDVFHALHVLGLHQANFQTLGKRRQPFFNFN